MNIFLKVILLLSVYSSYVHSGGLKKKKKSPLRFRTTSVVVLSTFWWTHSWTNHRALHWLEDNWKWRSSLGWTQRRRKGDIFWSPCPSSTMPSERFSAMSISTCFSVESERWPGRTARVTVEYEEAVQPLLSLKTSLQHPHHQEHSKVRRLPFPPPPPIH